MAFAGLRLQDITEAEIADLVAAQVPEGKTIDYKVDLPGATDSARKDFPADLSSFANASSGHLIYGVAEVDGLPTKIAGLAGDIDQAILRLESMARDGIRPPIPGFRRVIEGDGLALTATGNLTRAVVAEMCELIELPHYHQAEAFRFSSVVNEPDFLPLHVVRMLGQAAKLVRASAASS